MEDGRRKAYIKQQAAVRRKEGMGPSNLSMKRKLLAKTDRTPKKPKVMVRSVGVILEAKLPPPPVHRKGKGLMIGKGPVNEKRPILLRKDPQYSFNQLSSIITSEDYEDLDNHSIEAIGETSLFSLAQVCIRLFFHFVMLFVYSF